MTREILGWDEGQCSVGRFGPTPPKSPIARNASPVLEGRSQKCRLMEEGRTIDSAAESFGV
jgi:hypothetical protein